MKKPFIVIQSNPSNGGKTFVTKLQRETVVEDKIFGTKVKKETYYISGSKQLAKDMEVPTQHIEDNFQVVERPFTNEETGEVIQLKWLHLK